MNRDININVGLPSGIVLLTITFVVLKALEYLDWHWVWIFSPLWGSLGLLIAILLVISLIWALASLWEWLNEPSRRW